MEMEAGINASRVLGGGLVARKSTSFLGVLIRLVG